MQQMFDFSQTSRDEEFVDVEGDDEVSMDVDRSYRVSDVMYHPLW